MENSTRKTKMVKNTVIAQQDLLGWRLQSNLLQSKCVPITLNNIKDK